MKSTTMSGMGCCRLVAVLALVTCNCAATSPLVNGEYLPKKPGDTSYSEAHKIASRLVKDYRERVNSVSGWMMLRHIAEAMSGGGAVGAVTTENTWQKVSGIVTVLSSIFQVVTDQGALERQREAYARGIAVMECVLAVTSQANRPGTSANLKPKKTDQRARADILLAGIDAVEASVAAAVTQLTLGDTRRADAGDSRTNRGTRSTVVQFWKDGTNRCLSRLVPDVRPLE